MIACFVYIVFGVIAFAVMYIRTKDVLNPVGIMSFSLISVFGLSNLYLNPIQTPFSFKTHVVVLFAFFEMVLIGVISLKPGKAAKNEKSFVTPQFNHVYYFAASIALVAVCILLFQSNASVSLLEAPESGLDKKSDVSFDGASRVLVYCAQCLPFIAIYAFFHLLYSNHERSLSRLFDSSFIIFAYLYAFFITVSRGTLIVMILGMLFLYTRKHPISLRAFFVSIVVIALLSSFYMLLRVDSSSMIYAGSSGSRLFNVFYNYTALNYSNLDALISNQDFEFTGFLFEWEPIAKFIGIHNDNALYLHETGALNARTMLYGFYHDLGIVGVLIYTALITSALCVMYRFAQNGAFQWWLMLAVLQKAIFMVCFGDYFIRAGGVAGWIPYLLTLGVVYLCFSNGASCRTAANDSEDSRSRVQRKTRSLKSQR